MRRSLVFRLFLTCTLIACVFTGCSRDPNVRKQKYFESGQRYFEKGKYREAAIQYSNAIQVDPRFADAHYRLALTYLKLGEASRAFQQLSRTLEIEPENYQARIDATNMLIASKYFKEAQEHLDILTVKQPNNPAVHMAVANLKDREGDLPGAMQEMQKAISLDPNRSEAFLNYAILQIQAQQYDAAEASLKKAAALDPKAMTAQLTLGSFYQSPNHVVYFGVDVKYLQVVFDLGRFDLFNIHQLAQHVRHFIGRLGYIINKLALIGA